MTGFFSLLLVLLLFHAIPNKDGISPFLSFIKKFVCQKKELDYHIPSSFHTNSTTTNVPKSLLICSHIYLCINRIRKPLKAPYQGPFEMISNNPKCSRFFFLLVRLTACNLLSFLHLPTLPLHLLPLLQTFPLPHLQILLHLLILN